MKTKTNEEILFDSYIKSAGLFYEGSRIYLPAGWPFRGSGYRYIATIDFHTSRLNDPKADEIAVEGYGYPVTVTVTVIAEQLKAIFNKKVELVFLSEQPREDHKRRIWHP